MTKIIITPKTTNEEKLAIYSDIKNWDNIFINYYDAFENNKLIDKYYQKPVKLDKDEIIRDYKRLLNNQIIKRALIIIDAINEADEDFNLYRLVEDFDFMNDWTSRCNVFNYIEDNKKLVNDKKREYIRNNFNGLIEL
ncbi:hypothetical protein H5203_21845 [Pseudoalteromonas sp. SG41-1]|uniref:hypothetical protein n=1 Tax=Pseudoalteromonas sp. SG41-1 TaxID=2760979 RepID=UPI00160175A4|nr:hypothetical protein [Pseudoalteromonas sp. SG41-1]MBB1508082.1 hypothetical protein [Pseudoalteromonas sp. SG41-1]